MGTGKPVGWVTTTQRATPQFERLINHLGIMVAIPDIAATISLHAIDKFFTARHWL
jgi:hypothetical protein